MKMIGNIGEKRVAALGAAALCFACGVFAIEAYAQGDAVANADIGDAAIGNAVIARFWEGCKRIASAEAAPDGEGRNALYAEAMDLLNPRRGRKMEAFNASPLRYEMIDSSGLASPLPNEFCYDYNYARSRYKGIDFIPSGTARGTGKDCRLVSFVLKPHGKVSISDEVKGECQTLVVAQPGREIDLKIEDADIRIDFSRPEGAPAVYAEWQSTGEYHRVTYTIENRSEQETTISIAAN